MCQSIEDQQYGRRVVVDNEGVFRPGECAQQTAYVVIAQAPLAPFQVKLQVGISSSDFQDSLQGFVAQGCTAKIGM